MGPFDAVDVVQLSTLVILGVGLLRWQNSHRRQPIMLAVIVVFGSNAAFIAAATFHWFDNVSLNLFSAVRVLLLALLLAAIPSSRVK